MSKLSTENITEQNYKNNLQVNFISGIWTGMCSAVIFHPLDRAIHRSINNKIPFLRMVNFNSPFQCVTQSVVQKTLSGGAYFFLQVEVRNMLENSIAKDVSSRELLKQFGTGLIAGTISCLINSPFSAVKYYAFGDASKTYYNTGKELLSKGGNKSLFRGLWPSIVRDGLQACTYEIVRFWLYNLSIISELGLDEKYSHFLSNILASVTGSVVCSPVNYVRSLQFATPPDKTTKGIIHSLSSLYSDSNLESKSVYNRAAFFGSQCKVGPGIVLAASRVAVGQAIFDYTKAQF